VETTERHTRSGACVAAQVYCAAKPVNCYCELIANFVALSAILPVAMPEGGA
jgi:hypothetical protein